MPFATFPDDALYHLTTENGRMTLCGKPAVEDAGGPRAPRPRRARITTERLDGTGLTLCPRCREEERKDATGAAKMDAERRLDALIDQLPVGVLFRDPQGRCTESNQKVCDILGVVCPDLISTKADELFTLLRATKPDGTHLESGEAPSLIAVRTRHPTEPVELLITTPARDARRIVVRAAPVALSGEEPFGSVAVVTDVTESRTLQQQLQHA